MYFLHVIYAERRPLMRKKCKLSKIDALILITLLMCLLLLVFTALTSPILLFLPLIIFTALFIFVSVKIQRLHSSITKILHGSNYAGSGIGVQQGLADITMPVAIASEKEILWYNTLFKTAILNDNDNYYLPIDKIFSGMGKLKDILSEKRNIEINGELYTVYISKTQNVHETYVLYFVNDTLLKTRSEEYINSRPAVIFIDIDTFDEIVKEMKDSDRSRILSEINSVLEQFIGLTTGMMRKISASRYFAVVEERHIEEMVKNKFSVLDKAREISGANGVVSLSIGIGRGGDTILECEKMAIKALDMAFGRGGDQVAIKTKESFEFYGGVLRSVEKGTKVRSRVIANALCELIKQSDNVIVTGHKQSDLDSVGASAGVYRIAKMCNKPVYIMVDSEATQAEKLIDSLKNDGVQFVKPESAEMLIERKTLLIIVDTHLSSLLESKYVYENAANVVVIDHHRRCVGYIENAVIFYHEPASSSASELVSELLQYTQSAKDNKLTQVEAQALLSGIMLDTRNFSVHTGVRTFEAAAYLRRMGAQTPETKKLFTSSLESYTLKAKLVAEAEIFMDCAIAVHSNIPQELSTVAPQAANDLLTIEGVLASFVIVKMENQVVVSARSMGDINVQIIMEKMGGGGHHTMAGTQIKNTDIDEVKLMVERSIKEYKCDDAKN